MSSVVARSAPVRTAFARTKIQPPRLRPGGLIERPALEARLREALLASRLVLVSAAAGFGKTSALARQIALLPEGTAVAWIACDEGDMPEQLFECLVAALEPYDPPWRIAPEALVAQASRADTPAARRKVAIELLNALDACDVPHGVIMVDDLHRVERPEVHEFLDLLLERLSPRWTLAIASRVDPPIALARLRARGELAEFRQADLRFDLDETRRLAAASGLDTPAADSMLERTQGWPVGLRLALNGMRPGDRPATGAIDRQMFEFLAAEVLDRLSPELREFLTRSSVLAELTASRAAAVTGNPRAAALIDEIERRGLFVSVIDESEPTLRLHDLFRAALEHRLQREHPQELAPLLRRAAANEPDPARRIGYLLRAGDLAEAAVVLRDHAPALLTGGALAGVAHLLEQFPRDEQLRSPDLRLVRGVLSWARWDFRTMAEATHDAQAGFRARGDEDGARLAEGYEAIALNALGRTADSAVRLTTLRRESLRTETRVVVLVACLWHALDLGSLHRVGPLMDELVGLIERSDDLSLWYRSHPLPRFNGLPGTAGPLQRYASGALQLCGDTALPLRALAYAQRGFQEAWTGRLDAAEEMLALGRADAHWLGEPPNVRGTLQLLGTLLPAMRGQREQALAAARDLVEQHPPGRGNWSLWGNMFYAARIAAAYDDLPTLREWLQRLQSLGHEVPAAHEALLRPLQGHLAWHEGRREEAVRLGELSLQEESRIERLGYAVELRLRLADGQLAIGRVADAARTLAPLFERVPAWAGLGGVLLARSVLPRLALAPWGALLDEASVHALRAWAALAEACARADGGAAAPPASTAVESPGGLSARELEVLERIAAGDSNKLIARAFDLSPHTVKRHVANILDKLGLDSRGQAAAWYRDHVVR